MFGFFVTGTIGMIMTGVVIVVCERAGWNWISTRMLYLPWFLCGMVFVSLAYRQGLRDGRKN
ncbi:MAG: hypothetical protein MUC65_10625 [Pontiellaceae bacterium]|jgi:uncharacterized MAPEG superfamily protein|nr:hypothetical protein [Pontiellaceae bacterium]